MSGGLQLSPEGLLVGDLSTSEFFATLNKDKYAYSNSSSMSDNQYSRWRCSLGLLCVFRRKQTSSVHGHIDKEKRVLGLGAGVDSRLSADISDLRMDFGSPKTGLGHFTECEQQRDLI